MDVFEIKDFTTASPLEKFVKDLEEVIREWTQELPDGTSTNDGGVVLEREISYAGRDYLLGYVSMAVQNLEVHSDDSSGYGSDGSGEHGEIGGNQGDLSGGYFHSHLGKGPFLTKCFGVDSFLTLKPKLDRNIPQNENSTLLSSLALASTGSGCALPLFVPIGDSSKQLYLGCSSQFSYDSRVVPAVPGPLTHLSGILDFFTERTRLCSPITNSTSELEKEKPLVAASCSFFVSHHEDANWRDRSLEESLGFFWGCEMDPLRGLRLITAWPFLPQGNYVQNNVYSNLQPQTAPDWFVEPEWSDSSGGALLASAICGLLAVVGGVLGEESPNAEQGDTNQYDDEKHEPSRAIKNNLSPSKQISQALRHTLSEEAIIARVFAWDDGQSTKLINDRKSRSVPLRLPLPFGSLLCRLVFEFCKFSLEGRLTVETVTALWTQFVHHLRDRWENLENIPYLLSSDEPDFAFCLLHQKLQLLQRCIRFQRKRSPIHANGANDDSSSQSDNFQTPDASDDDSLGSSCAEQSFPHHPRSVATPDWGSWNQNWDQDDSCFNERGSAEFVEVQQRRDRRAEDTQEEDCFDNICPSGRKKQLSLLLVRTGKPMFAPKTQEVAVMTSDAFEEQLQIFARLGNGPEATRIRAEMQGASVVSDMQSFKAANPGAVLEDFVRWHSPKDWRQLPSDSSSVPSSRKIKGQLSIRFSSALWMDLWKTAKPLPAADQKPLFDPQAEAERILNDLEHSDLTSLFQQLAQIAVASGTAVFAHTDGATAGLHVVNETISGLQQILGSFETAPADWFAPDSQSRVFCHLEQAELLCSRAASLLAIFPHASTLVDQILRNGQGRTIDRDRDQMMHLLSDRFSGETDEQNSKLLALPNTPTTMEFTLVHPTSGSRMHTCVNQDGSFLAACCWQKPALHWKRKGIFAI
mmetsp:Transcript_49630/g.97331  ORF Transcript_49630/g.97331 Transcript_49630/m.97331 type:complete len:921 (+) Transcript_49630:25-2787(+)